MIRFIGLVQTDDTNNLHIMTITRRKKLIMIKMMMIMMKRFLMKTMTMTGCQKPALSAEERSTYLDQRLSTSYMTSRFFIVFSI
jgi:hypothetical protein